MDAAFFIKLAEELTGTPVKPLTDDERDVLTLLLNNDAREISHSHLNELLLLVNKDRVARPFFKWFFGATCTVGGIAQGVAKFRKLSMLCYGNFIHGYRTLSQAATDSELFLHLAEWGRSPGDIKAELAGREEMLIDITRIDRAETPLVGYISPGEILAEDERLGFLRQRLPAGDALDQANWDDYEQAVAGAATASERSTLAKLIQRYREQAPTATVGDFATYLNDEVAPAIERNTSRLEAVRTIATKNQTIYLTWDHMDVYFATSMRKRWEFEDLFDFVDKMMAHEQLTELKLRHFDPTQAFTNDRIDKGLVESLMLKRAKCTVYSVQDTDTLGKDSELAATLAQGKPVIAYVPTIPLEERAANLQAEDPATIHDRLRFVVFADERFAQSVTPEDYAFVRDFRGFEEFENARMWRTVPTPTAVAQFREDNAESVSRICRIIAAAEARIYDKRAKTLKEVHPLGIQVNLASGVANGVLVARTTDQCAELLRRLVTNELEFDLEDGAAAWLLRERISGCIYRVVSKDRKLTNCFWNFYRGAQT